VAVGCEQGIRDPKAPANHENLAYLSSRLSNSKDSRMQKLGAALFVFTALVLVVAGILAAVPTGGLSLVAAGVGAALGMKALTVAAGVGVGLGTTLVAGLGLFSKGKRQADEKEALKKEVDAFSGAFENVSPKPSQG
jgi:hypothetical protein